MKIDVCKKFDISNPSWIRNFRLHIYKYFDENGRTLPWRTNFNPYHIFISEVMLQQTQVDRVAPKFESFIQKFPDFKSLANATVEDVYSVWQGLGYNRRAIALRDASKKIYTDYNGMLPDKPEILATLPGIGPATASSIVVFAFNKPVIFLETNIRTIYIHHFFPEDTSVGDELILPIAQKVIDKKNPRKWYSALMDYGTMLKKEFGNITRKSTTYKKATAFKGSRRQLRGLILKQLLSHKELSIDRCKELTGQNTVILTEALAQLVKDGMVMEERNVYRIAE